MTPTRRPPPQITDAWLRRAALSYLRLHPATSDRLRLVMARKVLRAIERWGGDRDEALLMVEALVGSLREAGELDDERLVRARVDHLRRHGVSRRGMLARLARQDAPASVVAEALEDQLQRCADPELEAAVAYARRRRLGPFSSDRAARRERDLACLGRAGFEIRAALAVVDAGSIEDLLARLEPV